MEQEPPSGDEDKGWDLRPLTPEYVPEDHHGYVEAIDKALGDERIRNIALSGNFGVGKSSILEKVADNHRERVVELSLSTLAPAEVNGSTSSTSDASAPEKSPTNRIQKEIVKQLLYRMDPEQAPASRFRRIESFNWSRERKFSAVIGLLLTLVFLVTGWTDEVFYELHLAYYLGVWVHFFMFFFLWGVTLSLRRLLYGRLHIRQLSTGTATVTLDENSTSYFDQYLDEIFYFFTESERDIVVFEDIDRFDDPYIFETLLSLNNLLNSPAERKKDPIRFIYAIKDSIFDRVDKNGTKEDNEEDGILQGDSAFSEVARANRTKFFDLVVPVVPFISHQNAKDLAVRLLKEIDHNIALEVIDIATRHIPDMRLLKNIRNEFVVFRDRVLKGHGADLDLNETELFAMMLYKSTHLADFELIRVADSRLDAVYDKWRQIVRQNKSRIEKEIRQDKRRASRIDSMRPRSVELGDRLISYVKSVHGFWPNGGNQRYLYVYKGDTQDEDSLRSPEFWERFTSDPGNPKLEWKPFHGEQPKWEFDRERLKDILQDDLDPEGWIKEHRVDLEANLERCASNLEYLGRSDIGKVMARPEFKVDWNGKERSLDFIVRYLLGDGLAYSLLRHGYINQNFALYSSVYHGDRVSATAKRFIIHNIDRGIMDEHFRLSEVDVDAVLRERGREAMGTPVLYNIDILDRLLEWRTLPVDKMFESLASFQEDEERFLQAYLEGGQQKIRFVQEFCARSGRVLVHLVEDLELSDSDRRELVDVALKSLVDGVSYEVTSSVADYLKDNHPTLSALTSSSLDKVRVQRVSKVFSKGGIKVPDIGVLGEAVRHSFIDHGLYEINRKNLSSIVGNSETLGLDSIRMTNLKVYRMCLEGLPDYLSSIKGWSDSVANPDEFVDLVEDVLDADPDSLAEVVRYASRRCEVQSLEEITSDAWADLASDNRFPANYHNVRKYVDVVGSIDSKLGNLLRSSGRISDHEDVEAEDRANLAIDIASSGEHLPSAEVRVALIDSLNVGVNVTYIAPENGELFALLLKAGIIEDNEESYGRIIEEDWPTRELFISESSKFSQYVCPEFVADDLKDLFQSGKVSDQVKDAVLKRVEDYVPVADLDGMVELARYSAKKGHLVPAGSLATMAQAGVEAELLVTLLRPQLTDLSIEEICGVLESLGESYAGLCVTDGRKVSVPRTDANQALVKELKTRGMVSSSKAADEKINVKMKNVE